MSPQLPPLQSAKSQHPRNTTPLQALLYYSRVQTITTDHLSGSARRLMGLGGGGGTSTQPPQAQPRPGGPLPPGGTRIVAGEQLGVGTTGRNSNEQSGRKSSEVPVGKGNGVAGGEGVGERDDFMSFLPTGTGSGGTGGRAALMAQDAAARAMEQEKLAKILEDKKKGATSLSSILIGILEPILLRGFVSPRVCCL